MNQPDGFDCPGCAWPDPKHTSSFEVCENGAKAVTWVATPKRVDPEFFAQHTISELWEWSDHTLEAQGRLTTPLRYDAKMITLCRFHGKKSLSRREPHCRLYEMQTRPSFTHLAVHRMRQHFFFSCSHGNLAPIISPIALICATKRQALGCRRLSVLGREPSRLKTSIMQMLSFV